uniref:WW domain-containing protein n=1 Tax=Micromonas pusilla TaxID=38833 RepID=A0A7S0KXR4_MICPS|mmetsp:Transcript_9295/g.36138  ORF Transcript_9295/g.36138 Transcript_9295/m.36138 type:complete len:685 (+) Transcript_9295:31-2085(+)
MGGPGAEEDEETRLARAIAESKAQASKRTATIFAPSDLPDYQPRPEVNWGERWELEEALATVPASQGGAAAAAAMGMAHPEIEGSSLAGTGIARRAIPEALPAAELDPAERGFHADDDASGSPADDGDDRTVWVKTYDPNEDDFYFYNPETRETTWEEPAASAAKIMLHHAIEGNARARRKLGLDPPGGPDDGGDDGGAHDGGAHGEGAEGADGYGRVSMAEMLDDVKVYEYEDVRAVWNGMPTETEEERRTREVAEAASRAKDPLAKEGKEGKESKRAARKKADEMQERLWRLQDERQRREDAAAGVAGIVYEGTAGLWAAKAEEARAAAVAAAANDDDDNDDDGAARAEAGSGAPVSEWAIAAMEGLAAAEAGRAPGPPAAPASSSRKEWYYRDDGGVWQGPWSVDELRGWRSMLPMELAVRRAGINGGAPVDDAGESQSRNQNLASVLGDDELLARAAAMDVHLPPRATATQAEIAIETVIAMRAGNAGRGDDDDAAGVRKTATEKPPAGMSAPPPPRPAAGVASSMVDSVLAGLNPEQYRAVVSGGVDPADMARALVAKAERDRASMAEAARAGVGDGWTSSGYATEARYNKITGRVTAAPAGSFATGGGGGIYAGGALDHHIDVNKLEEGLWEMKRAKERRKERALSKQEIDRLKKRRAEIKKKHYVAPWDVGFEKVQD